MSRKRLLSSCFLTDVPIFGFSKLSAVYVYRRQNVVFVVAVHAAIIAINDAVDRGIAVTTLNCLLNPAAHMSNIMQELSEDYQTMLYDAKCIKKEIAFNKVTFMYSHNYIDCRTVAQFTKNISKIS